MHGVIRTRGPADPADLRAMASVWGPVPAEWAEAALSAGEPPRISAEATGPTVHGSAAWGPAHRLGRRLLQWDGEIYNGNDLRRDLGLPAQATDATVVLEGWKRIGPGFLSRVEGPFALAILDLDLSTWSLARGAWGLRPLFWFESADGIVFAGDIRTLLGCSWVSREPHWERIPEYLVYDHVAGGETLYRSVRELLPGQVLSGTLGRSGTTLFRVPPPWPPPNHVCDPDDVREGFRGALEASTEKLLGAGRRAPPAIFLSGGVDSALLAETLRRRGRAGNVLAATVVCPGYKHDESLFARTVRESEDLAGTEIPLEPSGFALAWQEAVSALKTPLVSTNQAIWWMLCRWARDEKRPVVLSGEGADGWFAGGLYDDERAILERSWCEDPEAAALQVISCRTHILNDPSVVKRISTLPLDLSGRRALWEAALRDVPAERGADDAATLYQVRTTGNRLLTRADLAASRHGLLLRLPYLESGWTRLVLSLPFRVRNRNGVRKAPLKELCMSRWGEAFAYRKKIGFPFPLRTWIRDAKVPLLEFWRRRMLHSALLGREIYRKGVLEEEIGPRLDGRFRPADWLLWSLINVEMWLADLEASR